MDEQALREQLKTQVEGLNRHYGQVGVIAHEAFETLTLAAQMLMARDGEYLPETRADVSRKLGAVLHEMATARHSIDLERREVEDTRVELRRAIAARKNGTAA